MAIKSSTLGMDADAQGMTFLIENMGKDCPPMQYIRELTQNSIEAILRGGFKSGEIVWDIDETLKEATGLEKLCIIDTGIAMAPEEMTHYLNKLSVSGGVQGFDKNFGIGGKIAAATKNQAGIIYESWQQNADTGNSVVLWKDPDSELYGLRQLQKIPGKPNHVRQIGWEKAPKIINSAGHGTKVTLFGDKDEANTFRKDDNTIATKNTWIAYYLNSRYFKFPENITVQAREHYENKYSQLRRVNGMQKFLKDQAVDFGTEIVSNAKIHWWILEKDAAKKGSGWYYSTGHVAALYQNEMYNFTKGKSAISRLQSFGVFAGASRVVIYVEPTGAGVMPNVVRTELQLRGDSLPWDEYCEEFRAKLPAAIKKLVDDEVAKFSHGQEALKLIAKIRTLFNFPRYRAFSGGDIYLNPAGLTIATDTDQEETDKQESAQKSAKSKKPTRSTAKLDAYIQSEFETPTVGNKANEVSYPKIHWVEEKPEDYNLTDRAACYLATSHTIYINANFRGFTHLIEFVLDGFQGWPGARTLATKEMRNYYELSFMESVLGMLSIQASTNQWSAEECEKALSPEALTLSAMQRFHQLNQIRRTLKTEFNRVNELVSAG